MPEFRSENSQQLRDQAVRLLEKTGTEIDLDPGHEFKQLVYDLRLYQAELEIQNDELRRVQLELEFSRNRYQDLYDFAPVGYVTVCAKGLVESANLVAADLLEVSRPALVGSALSDYVTPDYSDSLYLHFVNMRRASERQSCELQLKTPGAQKRFVRLDSVALKVKGSQTPTLRISITDVTQEKADAVERRKLEEERQNTDRLRTLGSIAGGVAHDFNNLLCPVMSFAELASMQIDAESPAQDPLKKVTRAVSAAAELCKKMLGYVGAEQVDARPLDVYKTIMGVLPLLDSQHHASIQLTASCEGPVPSIKADATQVERVIQNLVINSIDAIGENSGTISVSAWTTRLDQKLLETMSLGGGASPGEFVCIEVCDDGCGMDAATQTQVFDPFFTTKFSGRGLGMASVVGIVRSHQAAISIDSQVNSGTSIGVYFPVSDQAPVERAELPSREIVAGSGTILIVDDERLVCDATQAILQMAGYDVKVATSGQVAIDLFRDCHCDIDLVLLDLAMPGFDGVQTLQELRKIQPDVLVCMRSGFARHSTLKELDTLSVAEIIPKPCSGGELTLKLREALAANE